MYREFPTTIDGLACLWVRTADADADVRVMPDACSDLVWRGGTEVALAGPDTTAWVSPVHAGDVVVGARFAPGAGAAVGFPIAEARDARTPYLELPDAPKDPVAVLADLAAQLLRAEPPDPAVAEAARRLADPGQRVTTLADDLGYSERQLRRRFVRSVGYGPKTLQRVLRFRRFLTIDGDLAERAALAGYADQAHLTHECRELAGTTPARLL